MTRDDENDEDRADRFSSPMQIYVGGECVYDPDHDDEPTKKGNSTKDQLSPRFAVRERYDDEDQPLLPR